MFIEQFSVKNIINYFLIKATVREILAKRGKNCDFFLILEKNWVFFSCHSQ
ncbi:hypothetical protein WDU94_004245 [Cyamophila willieti]